MLICGDCYKLVDEEDQWTIRTSYGGDPEYIKEFKVCPYCEGECLVPAIKCKNCGEYIVDRYMTIINPETEETEYICYDCYVEHDIDEMFDKRQWFGTT